LNLVSKLPHKRLAANAAPPMDKTITDFAQANKMLADATRSARSLAKNPEGTNVKYTGDLTRVAADWTKYAQAYAAGVNTLITAINKEAKSEDAAIKKTAKQVTDELTEAASHFDALAFANSFKVLKNEKATEDKKLAAREVALRVVRHYKKDLLSDPL